MDITSIDWNQVWKEQREKRPRKKRDSQYWNQRAPSFADHVYESIYSKKFIKIIKPSHTWTVLDMGCGSGTLAIPLASKVKKITAVDFSSTMLSILQDNARKEKIKNIETVNASWEDDWDKAGIGIHDIAIASRSLAIDDLQSAIIKLNNAARKRVYISTATGDGPYDRMIFEAIGRKFIPPIDYIYVYNLIYQMGIYPNITFIINKNNRIYDNHETALNSFDWMLKEKKREEIDRLDRYLREHLVRYQGKWILDYKKIVRWAILWWNKE